ncbi:MAG: MaoC family dehydratase N-terminal domain-containing protein [Rhizobiaceae bacterium]|nr:MaoC family dehydratase N-terminal domain-containing protein [Rhizobiaceae bacterium]
MSALYLEDFTVGSVWHTPALTLDRDRIIEFAEFYDAQYYHLDDEAAKESIFGRLVAPGFQTASFAWKLGMASGYFDECALAGIGIDELRWLAPVDPGDALKCRMEVLENVPSSSKPDRGFLKIRYEMTNQNGVLVMTLNLLQMLRRRPSEI